MHQHFRRDENRPSAEQGRKRGEKALMRFFGSYEAPMFRDVAAARRALQWALSAYAILAVIGVFLALAVPAQVAVPESIWDVAEGLANRVDAAARLASLTSLSAPMQIGFAFSVIGGLAAGTGLGIVLTRFFDDAIFPPMHRAKRVAVGMFALAAASFPFLEGASGNVGGSVFDWPLIAIESRGGLVVFLQGVLLFYTLIGSWVTRDIVAVFRRSR